MLHSRNIVIQLLSYFIVCVVCGGVLVNTSYGYLHSPHYPAYYPLNSICAWTFPATTLNQSIMFHFTAFCLADNHSLVVSDNISTAVRNYSRDMMPADYLVAGNVTVTVTFSAPLVKVQSALGFAIDYYVVSECCQACLRPAYCSACCAVGLCMCVCVYVSLYDAVSLLAFNRAVTPMGVVVSCVRSPSSTIPTPVIG